MALATILPGAFAFMILSPSPALDAPTVRLPGPSHDSGTSVEKALSERRSVRSYSGQPLTLAEVSRLLWAAQGVTDGRGLRTAPSAGALYPLEVYVAAGDVRGLPAGVYRYKPGPHALERVKEGDARAGLAREALGQESIRTGAIDIVIAGVYERATGKYGARLHDERTGSSYPAGVRYVHMEAGHASQNVYLQAESLGLGTVAIGALSDGDVRQIMGMMDDERPLYIMPVGRK